MYLGHTGQLFEVRKPEDSPLKGSIVSTDPVLLSLHTGIRRKSFLISNSSLLCYPLES